MTPMQRYQQDIQAGKIRSDPLQIKILERLQVLHARLADRAYDAGWLNRLRNLLPGVAEPAVKGMYLWGGVGRGKTYMVDLFFDCLPFEDKLRIHFHRFMQRVHHELQQHKNQQHPLRLIAARLAQQAKVICFDEFYVADITDAMLLGGLFSALFANGVTLVATSNVAPDRLYWDGLQRVRFLPAIALIKQHTEVIEIAVTTDYRLRYLDQAKTYHYPLSAEANAALEHAYLTIAPDTGRINSTIEIENRKIRNLRFCDGVVWFDFKAICDGPRGPADYIGIARQFQTVLISGVMAMDDETNDLARRFISLVDEFYDRNVTLIIAAEVSAAALYQGRRLAEEFKRTYSRLMEMQTCTYLARPHLA